MPVNIGSNACGIKTATTNKRPFRVKRSYRKILRNRKQRIERRLHPKNWEGQARPMLKASHIQYEMAARTLAMNCGGIGAMHLMVQRLGLVEDIDKHLQLLKVHLPYHESDHVLNLTYNLLAGGQRMEDIELRRQDEVFLNGLGAERIPDPTTAGDFTRRFRVEDIVTLQECCNRRDSSRKLLSMWTGRLPKPMASAKKGWTFPTKGSGVTRL
jgi:hypothetical protein